VPCHHGIARPEVAIEEERLHTWKVAANILNKQLRTTEKGRTPVCEVGAGLTTPYRKKRKLLIKYYQRPRTWTRYMVKWPKLGKRD
jgi:hypothetical protein